MVYICIVHIVYYSYCFYYLLCMVSVISHIIGSLEINQNKSIPYNLINIALVPIIVTYTEVYKCASESVDPNFD